MTELRDGRKVNLFVYAGYDSGNPTAGETAEIVIENGQCAPVPWIRYTYQGRVLLANCAHVAFIIFDDEDGL